MSNDREKLLDVMKSLEHDYRSGKISAEKYSYFRSKYEDKLNSIDAQEATRRIRSMQGKSPSGSKNRKKTRKPTVNKEKQKEDLVQKYIINPKKDDAKYNKKQKTPMDGGTFKLLLLLVLVLGFTVGVGFGVFNFDFNAVSDTAPVAIVQDTAFPEFTQDVVQNTTTTQYNSSYSYDSDDSSDDVETTTDTSSYQESSSDYSSSSQSGSSSSNYESSSSSGSDGGSSSEGSSDTGGEAESGEE